MIPVLPSIVVPNEQSSTGPTTKTTLTARGIINYVNSRRNVRLAVIASVTLFFFTICFTLLWSNLHEIASGTIYRFHRQKAQSTASTQFVTQNPIFTKRLSADSLNSLLKKRRKIVGGTVNNTLIAACSGNSHIHPQIISSWLSIHGLREIIIVHDNPSLEQTQRALRTIEFIDRHGRIIYVNLATHSSTDEKEETPDEKQKDKGDEKYLSEHHTLKYQKGFLNGSETHNVNDSKSDIVNNEDLQNEHQQNSIPLSSPSPQPQPNHTKRWFRTRAFNFGAAISTGKNLVFTDCRTMISTESIIKHELSLNKFFISVGNDESHISDIKPIELVYIRKEDFMTVHGFDERIDIAGYDFANLIQRLVYLIPDLSWNNMKYDSTHIIDLGGNYLLTEKYQISGAKTLESKSSLIPQLAFYTCYFTKDEIPTWNGQNSVIHILHKKDGHFSPLSLSINDQFIIRILRSHYKSVDGHSRKLAMFVVPSRISDFKIWIHASINKPLSNSMIDDLPRDKKAKIMLKAHRKLLHDHHGIPWNLLNIIEGSNDTESYATNTKSNVTNDDISILSGSADYSNDANTSELLDNTDEGRNINDDDYSMTPLVDLERKLEGYSPILLDILWRKSKLLVVNIQADYAMELIRAISWSISLAVSQNRVLMIIGDLQGLSIFKLIDLKETSKKLKQEYNIQLNIIGRKQLSLNNCNINRNESIEKKLLSCWFHNDNENIINLWDEYHIKEIQSISKISDNSMKHILLYIPCRDIDSNSWNSIINLNMWQKQLQIHAFSSIQISKGIIDLIAERHSQGWNHIQNRTALWITRSSRDKQTVKSFAFGYLTYLEQRMNGISNTDNNNNKNDLKYSKYSLHYGNTIDYPSKKSKKMASLLFMSDHAEMRSRMSSSTSLNSMQNVADVWVAMQCKRVVFDSEEIPSSWRGADECLLEWRRVNGYIPNDKKDVSGVVHVKSSDVGADIAFHEVEFVQEDDDETDDTVKHAPSSILTQ